MKKRLGCLHAHYSNIEYIEKALLPYDIECVHFVDPALMYRVTSDKNFHVLDAQNKVNEQIEWISKSNVDGILITCTNYIAILQEEKLSISIPIFKIDEPFFEHICNIEQPQMLLFTNPATVKGSIERLNQYAKQQKKSVDVEAITINGTFELIMQGLKKEYNNKLISFITAAIQKNKVISVAQLSMVDAAKEVEYMTSTSIINPLDTLVSYITKQLEMEK
ncbi:hypothetical protein DCE79_10020 [Lysinibacillus sp. 2017]|uniref:hypothetical protein n=1 Tax=unclassified Lysinibacillus TaxID=2636778 RepID=UPI000D5258A0|nr:MULTISPECIES: hypothetical protein [unclassified Lysinibacillus]AWE07698.1 hypothetical protein DCE79_10020 [Lysinibacillus sp. 2017]TGN36859.1 hypothetical protein E4L99_04715 [Lysinibacillus sp. S2017]